MKSAMSGRDLLASADDIQRKAERYGREAIEN